MENWDELKPERNRKELYRKLSQKFKQYSSILIVGHEPYLSSLIGKVMSEEDRVGNRWRTYSSEKSWPGKD
jgi:phosphohistidine phosphatase